MESDENSVEYAARGKSTATPKEDDGSDVKQVRATLTKNPWDNWKDDTTIFNSQVAATVIGTRTPMGEAAAMRPANSRMLTACSEPTFQAVLPGARSRSVQSQTARSAP